MCNARIVFISNVISKNFKIKIKLKNIMKKKKKTAQFSLEIGETKLFQNRI